MMTKKDLLLSFCFAIMLIGCGNNIFISGVDIEEAYGRKAELDKTVVTVKGFLNTAPSLGLFEGPDSNSYSGVERYIEVVDVGDVASIHLSSCMDNWVVMSGKIELDRNDILVIYEISQIRIINSNEVCWE